MKLPQNMMIVEDEMITQRYLKDIMTKNSIEVMGCFNNGEDALVALKEDDCGMALIDISIKGAMDGLRLTKRILDKYTIPIIFISAHSDNKTFEEVLELEPYGFISKPFSAEELEMTMQVAYRRFLVQEKKSPEEITNNQYSEIRINDSFTYIPLKSSLYRNDKIVSLNKRQISLIAFLCKNINNVISNESIKVAIWGKAQVSDTSLRTLIYNLRKIVPYLPLESHSKLGYCIASDK